MTESTSSFVQAFRDYLRRERMKLTRQRELIADTFAAVEGHVSVEELLGQCRDRDPAIGYATVYRTLKLLVDAGLGWSRNFGEGFARYEPHDDEHHDHLFCLACGHIEEFRDAAIEKRQEEVARELGYRLTHHRHEVFGICPDCLKAEGEEALERHGRGPRKAEGEDFGESFRRFLGQSGLKLTRQRSLIAALFSELDDHVRVEDLYTRARRRDDSIGHATVYRTLKLLVDAGLASCRHFGDGYTRFEPRLEEHHDHFIDEKNGQVIEFHDDRIEARQKEIARSYGYLVSHHRHDLFGVPLSDSSS